MEEEKGTLDEINETIKDAVRAKEIADSLGITLDEVKALKEKYEK